jgi:hypothetical protein
LAVQFSTTVRDALNDIIETTIGSSPLLRIYSGAKPTLPTDPVAGTLLVQYSLGADWMTASSLGVKSFSNMPLISTGLASGSAGYFRVVQGSTTHIQGTVSATGAGGDLTLDNASIAPGQEVSISQLTFTAPGA